MIDARVRLLEDAIDSGTFGAECLRHWPDAERWISFFGEGKWEELESSLAALFASQSDRGIRAAVIQIAVAGCETRYDLEARRRWMERWSEIRDWASDSYCLYLRTFQEGFGAFMEGSLQDAETRFTRARSIAASADYDRGQMRSAFHLGLVARDRGDVEGAQRWMKGSLSRAEARGLFKYAERIRAQLDKVSGEGEGDQRPSTDDFSAAVARVHQLCERGEFEQARRALVETELLRRRRRIARACEDLSPYRRLILGARRGDGLARDIHSRTHDSLNRLQVLGLKRKRFGLTDAEECEVAALGELYGAAESRVAGIEVSSVRHEDVRCLMGLMLGSKQALSKEEITTRLWNLSYDPVIHDRKVYKLIQKAKDSFGAADLFENTYGAYRIHPKHMQ